MLTNDIYEFITPSDPVTFKAQDDKVAVVAALVVSESAFVHKYNETGDKVEMNAPVLMFNEKALEDMDAFLGCELDSFIANNKATLAESLKSFAYGSVSDRVHFDDAVAAITDEKKLEDFLKKHEDRNRSSMNAIVKRAWSISKKITAAIEQPA